MADVVSEPEGRLNLHGTGESSAFSGGSQGPAGAADRPAGRNSAIVILLVWTAQFIYFSVDRLARDATVEGWHTFGARLVVTGVGILLSFAVLAALRRSAGASFVKRAILALALALAAATIHGVVNLLAFRAALASVPGAVTLDEAWSSFPSLLYFFSWIHLAVAVILLSLAYGEDLVHRDRRLAELAREADRARRWARRYRNDLAEVEGRLDALGQQEGAPGDEPHLWVRKGSERLRLDVARIDWVAAEGECVRFHSGDRSYLERMSISDAADRLRTFGFVRVHRSAVVNAGRIESLARTRWGALQLRLSSGEELRVSRSFQPLVRELVKGGRGSS